MPMFMLLDSTNRITGELQRQIDESAVDVPTAYTYQERFMAICMSGVFASDPAQEDTAVASLRNANVLTGLLKEWYDTVRLVVLPRRVATHGTKSADTLWGLMDQTANMLPH